MDPPQIPRRSQTDPQDSHPWSHTCGETGPDQGPHRSGYGLCLWGESHGYFFTGKESLSIQTIKKLMTDIKSVSRLLTEAEIREVLDREFGLFRGKRPLVLKISIFFSALGITLFFLNINNYAFFSDTGWVFLSLISMCFSVFSVRIARYPHLEELKDSYRCKNFFIFEARIKKSITEDDENRMPFWIGMSEKNDLIMLHGQSVGRFRKELIRSRIRIYQNEELVIASVESKGEKNFSLKLRDNKLADICERLSIRNGFTEVLCMTGKRKALFKQFF